MVTKRYGIFPCIVSNINDPDKRGRIKVVCPDVLGDEAVSAWCEPVVPVAYDEGGDFCLPPKGEAVWVMFIDGDVNRPVYLGGWWSTNKTPLGDDYSGLENTRVISYAGNKITMKDGVIKIDTGGDTKVTIKCDSVTLKGDVTVTGDLKVSGSVSAKNIE